MNFLRVMTAFAGLLFIAGGGCAMIGFGAIGGSALALLPVALGVLGVGVWAIYRAATWDPDGSRRPPFAGNRRDGPR